MTNQELNCRISLLRDKINEDRRELEKDLKMLKELENMRRGVDAKSSVN